MVSYNIGARYEVVGRIPSGTSVIAYVLVDKVTNTRFIMEKGMVEQLALNKQIYNCSAQVYGGIVNLKGINCKLNRLPHYDESGNPLDASCKSTKRAKADLQLVGKIQNGRTITYYVVSDIYEPDKLIQIPRDTVIRLAQDGRIVNVKVQKNGTDSMLRGVDGFYLSQLKDYSQP